MFLQEVFKLTKKTLAEGGNVSSQSPGWQGLPDQEAEEIDLKIHDRDFMVGQLRTLLSAQNESFKAAYGRYIWSPQLLKSGRMFSGSSLQFFDVKSVNTQDFLNKLKKVKVGDIDTQIDQEIGDEVTAWLKSVIGKKVGNGTFLGFNKSLSSLWKLDDPPVRVQIDYELGPYDPETQEPNEWFAYSHSSHYDDMAAGIKGVFHKHINRALTHAQASTKYVAKVSKKSVEISDEPVTDSDYSFAVSSAQGGGLSKKYKPYIDPNTGEPMVKDGIPVMVYLKPESRDYIQNLDQQFQIIYGRKRSEADKNLQGSFIGTLKLMNKTFSPEQNETAARAFLDILFKPGAPMINRDDPERDRDTKFAAIDAMLLGGSGIQPLNVPNAKGLRQEAVQMAMDYADNFKAKQQRKPVDTEVAEDAEAAAAAKPNYARQGIKHLYNRLPDGRVGSTEMKNAEFLELAKEIAENGGNLNQAQVSLKIDGAGIRFGKDESGRPFFMTSKVTTPLYQDDVGYFTSFGEKRGQDPEQLARTRRYDEALSIITGSKFIQALPPDTIVQAEMLYNPMAEKTPQGLKFVNLPYDPKKLGKQMTLVPITIKQYSTGDELPNGGRILKKLVSASDSNVKIVSNQLEQKGINVSKIINPILSLDPKKKENAAAFSQAKQELSDAIINNPKLAGKNILGDTNEGLVISMPSGKLFKVTTPEMKSAMTQKMNKTNPQPKTAVVAIGSFAGHRGHQDLFNYTISRAKELGGDPYLFIGNAVGVDDPIPPDVKLQTWHKLYPDYANNISYVMPGGSLLQKIKHELVNPQPGQPPKYDNIVIAVGEDRKDMPLAGALMKSVNKFPGYENVKAALETIPRGNGMSFTKLRNVLKDPNATPEQQYQTWAQGFDEQTLGKDWILHLMDVAKKGMGIKQQQPAAQPVAETRLFNALVRPKHQILSELNISQTLKFIQQAHGDQLYGKLPYWTHPRAVALRGKKLFGKKFDSNAVKVAFLHDVVEDTHIGLDELRKLEFDPVVIEAVSLLTKNKALSYFQNIENIINSGNEYAMMVKYADNYENFIGDKSDWDPARASSSQKKYLKSLDKLGDVMGIKHHLSEPQANQIPQPLSEGPSIETTLRAIVNDIGEPVAQVYATMTQMAKQFYDKNGTLDGFQLVAAGVGQRWYDKFYFNRLGKELHHLAGFVPKYSKDLKHLLLDMPKNFNKMSEVLPEVLEDIGKSIRSMDLVTKAQHWQNRRNQYRTFLEKLQTSDMDDDDYDEPVAKPPRSNIAGQQASQVEKIVADVLRNLPPKIAGDIRAAIARSDNKLMALQKELNRRNIKMGESMLPKTAFAGSKQNKLGPAAHATGKQKSPVKQGQFVGGMEEEKSLRNTNPCWKGYKPVGTKKKNGKTVPNCVPVSEDVEKIMGSLIEQLIRK